jgi:hypothetical protein
MLPIWAQKDTRSMRQHAGASVPAWRRSLRIERLDPGRLAFLRQPDLLDLGLGCTQQALAMVAQFLAALILLDRFFQRDIALFEPFDDLLELGKRILEAEACDIAVLVRCGQGASPIAGCQPVIRRFTWAAADSARPCRS